MARSNCGSTRPELTGSDVIVEDREGRLVFFEGCRGCEAIRRMLSRMRGNPKAQVLLMRHHQFHMERKHGLEPTDTESSLCRIPMVSHSRASLLQKLGIGSIGDVVKADPRVLCKRPEVISSKDTSFPIVLPLIMNYAHAISRRRPIVIGHHPGFFDISKPPYFMDLEYDPQGTAARGRFGIFLYGILDSQGNVVQRFLDDPNDEKGLIEWFSDWLMKATPALATYSSKSADEPHLRNSLRKFGLPADCLSNARFLDLFYDVIFTQSPKNQKIFLPISGSISSKRVAYYLGYREPKSVKIHDGLEALAAYKQYLRSRSERIRNDLLAYNRCDLERTSLIYNRLRQLFDKHREDETLLMRGTRR